MFCVADIFQSGMMLQRGKNIRVYGIGDKGQQLTVKIQNQVSETMVDSNGHWEVYMDELIASSKEELVIGDGTNTITFTDVAIGDIYVAAGQSNMEFWMRYEKHYQEAVKECNNADIRFFDTPKIAYDGQEDEFDYSKVGIWRKATTEDLEYFSAVGYYFARNLQQDLNIPIGIIGCNWGGTSASVWMSHPTLEKVGLPWLKAYQEQIKNMDLDAYWKSQHGNGMNDTGNSTWNGFIETFLPRTPGKEEAEAFFGNTGESAEGTEPMIQVQAIPSCLYEHMVKRIAPFSLCGVLWYQGESDDCPGCQSLYSDMLGGIISDWRKLWEMEELPFYIVQLPGYLSWLAVPNNDYMEIRRQQEIVCNTVPNTYLCSISDLGEEFDIHPKNKLGVGERLALLARKYHYKEEILADAPILIDAVKNGQEIKLTFENVGSGLHIKGDTINALEVKMDDKELEYMADICDNQVILTTKASLTQTVRIEFARTKWYIVNLYNSANLPAIPFTTEI